MHGIFQRMGSALFGTWSGRLTPTKAFDETQEGSFDTVKSALQSCAPRYRGRQNFQMRFRHVVRRMQKLYAKPYQLDFRNYQVDLYHHCPDISVKNYTIREALEKMQQARFKAACDNIIRVVGEKKYKDYVRKELEEWDGEQVRQESKSLEDKIQQKRKGLVELNTEVRRRNPCCRLELDDHRQPWPSELQAMSQLSEFTDGFSLPNPKYPVSLLSIFGAVNDEVKQYQPFVGVRDFTEFFRRVVAKDCPQEVNYVCTSLMYLRDVYATLRRFSGEDLHKLCEKYDDVLYLVDNDKQLRATNRNYCKSEGISPKKIAQQEELASSQSSLGSNGSESPADVNEDGVPGDFDLPGAISAHHGNSLR